MNKPTVRTGIVGSGFAASFHIEALRRVSCANVDVVGVYSPTLERRTAFAQKHETAAVDSLEALLERVDVVHVCTPPQKHEEITVAGLTRDKFVVCEKALTGFFGQGIEDFHGDRFPKQIALDEAHASLRRILDAERKSKGRLLYAENWVYAPSIQKEREIIEKTGAQVLWIQGEESHSGSHTKRYGIWANYGGGVLVGLGCHPLTAAMYLKRAEGLARNGKNIQPKTVSARTHAITRLPNYRDAGHIRCDYHDIDDLATFHVEFDDGTVADIAASNVVIGGIRNYLRVSANNHVTHCNINPNTALLTFNPREENFRDIYTVEKIETKQGWSFASPDEDWFTGYPQEMEAFYRTVAHGDKIESDSILAANAISTLYTALVSAERGGETVGIQTYSCD